MFLVCFTHYVLMDSCFIFSTFKTYLFYSQSIIREWFMGPRTGELWLAKIFLWTTLIWWPTCRRKSETKAFPSSFLCGIGTLYIIGSPEDYMYCGPRYLCIYILLIGPNFDLYLICTYFGDLDLMTCFWQRYMMLFLW
jgi:hypothetical protein